jgi:hypothetical protein
LSKPLPSPIHGTLAAADFSLDPSRGGGDLLYPDLESERPVLNTDQASRSAASPSPLPRPQL